MFCVKNQPQNLLFPSDYYHLHCPTLGHYLAVMVELIKLGVKNAIPTNDGINRFWGLGGTEQFSLYFFLD